MPTVPRMTARSCSGVPQLTLPGMRAVPSLTYLQRQPDFSIGPDDKSDDDNSPTLAQRADAGQTATRVQKTATQSASKR